MKYFQCSKMLSKIIVLVIAVSVTSAAVTPDYAQQADDINLRHFVHRCSYSSADLPQCFVKNGNKAIKELAKGYQELQIVSLDGFDIGDIFLSLDEDLSFLLENVKSYAQKPKLEKAKVRFDEDGVFESLVLGYSLADYSWKGKYRAIGFVNNTRINEKGNFTLDFGPFQGNYTANFSQKEIDGDVYLRVSKHSGTKSYDQFNFIPRDVVTKGVPLRPEQFGSIKNTVIEHAVNTRLDYITFVFNQVLLEIPQNELFLP